MPYRPQSANRLTERVHAAVRSVVSSANVANLLVACSGGADSTCLAHAIVTIARRAGWRITIAHVRHGVRPDDGDDAAAVRALAEQLGVSFMSDTLLWDAAAPRRAKSEAALRERRYEALARMAYTAGAQAVLTGHTMDDQAETVLLHLFRGAGLDGLAGMQPCATLPVAARDADSPPAAALRLIRPLLAIQRAETEAYCAAHGLTVTHDPSNDDETLTRNWLRHTVLPELRARNPNITPTLARAAASLANDAAFMRDETTRALARCGLQSERNVSLLDRPCFVHESPALRVRMLRQLFERHGNRTPRIDDLLRADRALSFGGSSRVMQFGVVACCVRAGRLLIGSQDDVRAWLARDAVVP